MNKVIMNVEVCNNHLCNVRRKKDKLMCTPLEKIRGKTASEILFEIGIENEIPIKLELILEHLGIGALPYDFTDLEKELGKGEILGTIVSSGNRAGIFYRNSDSANRQRFTIAHELGHCAMANDLIEEFVEFRHSIVSDDEKEIAANTFAGELLIPTKKLIELHKMMTTPYASLLAKVFSVSDNVMKARMDILELYYV